MIDSVPIWYKDYHKELYLIEWGFTIIFCLEYILRLLIAPRPLKYVFSFWGMIDLLAILPTLISPFVHGYETLIIIRSLRLLRIFRVLKMTRFMQESNILFHSLRASSYKITVFLFFVIMLTVISGTLMYVVEGAENGEWVLMDYVNIVVHVFQKHVREFYNIEGLWGDAKITTIQNKY